MNYIEKITRNILKPSSNQITLEEYLKETIYITKYMSPHIKATNIATYHAMFYLSYGENGTGSFSKPWPEIGSLCGNERNTGTVTKNEAVKERTKRLIELGCISIKRNRIGANDFYVYLPSQIKFVQEALQQEEIKPTTKEFSSNIDCYNNQERKLKILERDNSICQYCLMEINKETYYLDHINPKAKNGTNYKNNLISSCQICNSNKSDKDFESFLLNNYRKGLLKQSEYQDQLQYLKEIINTGTGEP